MPAQPLREKVFDVTISADETRRFYNNRGRRDPFSLFFEQRAKQAGLARLALEPGMRVLNVGVGPGEEQSAIQRAIAPGGVAYGVDIAREMLRLAQEETPAPANRGLYEADARFLPFPQGSFDRVFSSYMLDLIPTAGVPQILGEMRRVLARNGRLVLVGLTPGVTLGSRLLMGAWTTLYRVAPARLGGCRPVRLAHPMLKAGFGRVQRDVVVQAGMPSEVIVAYP